jgi:hypothetical protein
MNTKIRLLVGSTPRRIVTSALALGLVATASLMPATALPALATDYKTIAIASRPFSQDEVAQKTCLLRAERTLTARGFRVWDGANDGDRTVQAESSAAQILVTCVQQGRGVWGFVNAYADTVESAERLAEGVKMKTLGQVGLELVD